MDENKAKELSTISVAVELEGMDQVNEELDKMIIKLEKANSLADELTSKVKTDPDELKVLAKPLQEYLTSRFNPMCSVVVDVDRVTVVSKELSTPTDQTRRYGCLCWNVFSACPNDGEEMNALYSDSLTLQ